jgi:hypothetical protein
MKHVIAIGTAMVGVACLGWVPAVTAGDVETIGKIEMVSVNRMKIVEEDGKYILNTEVTFYNKGENAVKIRNGDFVSFIETAKRLEGKTYELTRKEPMKEGPFTTTGEKETKAERNPTNIVDRIELGTTTMAEVEIPGGTNKKPGEASAVSRVVIGPSGDMSTMKLLVRLSSVLGDPTTKMSMLLQGSAELGVKLPNGWVFEKGKKYEVDLRFHPAVERKVLFQ